VAKFSAGQCGLNGIIREALMSMLASDLDLPIPEPFLMKSEDGFIDALPADEVALARSMRSSVFPTFACRQFPPGFHLWSADLRLQERQVETAAEVFAFDALTMNPDRKVTNPNCMFNGIGFAIYDHELALVTAGLGTLLPPPWKSGALDTLCHGAGEHLLFRALKGRPVELTRLRKAWEGLSAERFAEYEGALPQEWAEGRVIVTEALAYLGELQRNLNSAFEEVRRILT
jgi:HipA-like kinase